MEDALDPLGTRPTVVQIEDLTRWNLTALLEARENGDENENYCPFQWRNDLNAKIILWCGDITTINVHGIVHSTNEKLNDKSLETDTLYAKAGPELIDDIRNNVKVCKTGEAKLTKGHKLLARHVIHTVGPRYNVKYITAAESALYTCYRNIMQLVRENSIKSIALYPVHSLRRGYPTKDGAHLAIRTIRRFLEKYGDDIETVIFCCNEETIDAYLKILPIYFPRNATEERLSPSQLPLDIGNEDGEPVIPERQIRIMDKPTMAALRNSQHLEFEETVDLNKEFATSTVVEVGRHPFAKMEEDPDAHKKSYMFGKTTDEQKLMDNKRRYERYLKRSKTEDLTDMASLKCLYRTGTDKFGRTVVAFVGKLFPANSVDLEKAFLYMLRVMEPVVDKDYVVVYFHTQSTSENHPPMHYLKNIYHILDEKYKKNLKAFYNVHPTWWSKLTTWFFTTFTASDLKRKVFNIKGVQYLYGTISPDQLDVPSFVINYDTEINGYRYYVPPQEEQTGGL